MHFEKNDEGYEIDLGTVTTLAAAALAVYAAKKGVRAAKKKIIARRFNREMKKHYAMES